MKPTFVVALTCVVAATAACSTEQLQTARSNANVASATDFV